MTKKHNVIIKCKGALLFIVVSVLLFSFVGCFYSPIENNSNQGAVYAPYSERDFSIYVDEVTGVNYIVYDEFSSGGICPRYNADGTLFITIID